VLAHEYALKAEEAEPFYQAMREGRRPARFGSNATGVATDYINLWEEIREAFTQKQQDRERNQ